MFLKTVVAVGGALLLVPACHDEGPSPLAHCPDSVAVSVGAGTTPTIGWTPSCRASRVIVDPNSDVVDAWILATVGDTDGLAPPIRYGASPNGSTTMFGPEALQTGMFYRVRILRAPADTGQPFDIVGGTYFTP